MGLQTQCETRYARARPELSPVCVHQENSGARPDVNCFSHTDLKRIQKSEARVFSSRGVCVCVFSEKSDADSETSRSRQLSMMIVNIETDAQTE